MNRFAGDIGFAVPVDNGQGGFHEDIVPKRYTGYVKYQTLKQSDASDLSPRLSMKSTIIEILANDNIIANFQNIRWVEFRGSKWEVDSVDYPYNRIALRLGGMYKND